MEPWVKDITESISKRVKVVDNSLGTKVIKKQYEDEENDNHRLERKSLQSGIDPHIWLDFDNAKIIAENIAKALIEIDPKNSNYYREIILKFISKNLMN